MKKKLLSILLITTMAVFAASCGNSTEDAAQEDSSNVISSLQGESIATAEPAAEEETAAEEVEEEEVVLADSAIITDREVVDGMMQSYLTGEWKSEEVVTRRPLAVMMPNNKAALPQYGISLASIIYEAPVEGRITRLMAIFEDYDELDRIGPVRSSRDYYIYEAMAYDAIYCNWGLAIPYVADLINSTRIDNVSQVLTGITAGGASEAYDRVSRSGYATEYTGYLFISGYTSAVERLGYSTTYTDRFVQAFTFANDGYTSEYADCDDATLIYPGGTSSNSGGYGNANPWFEYDEESGLYYRYEYGAAQVDEYNGQQITVSNVIFKVCHGEVRDDNDYLAFQVHGTGEAYIFTNGKVIHGTWVRESDYSGNFFYDDDGNEIVLNQGKTWICNIWQEYSEYMYWE